MDRAQNLNAWHKDSHPLTKNPDGTPKVFYHGTRNDFSQFNKEHRSESTRSIFVSKTPEMAHFFATVEHDKPGNPNIMPLFVHTKNPFDYENPDHVKRILNVLAQEKDLMDLEGPEVLQYYKKGLEKGDWGTIEDPWVQDAIEKNHDGFFAHGFFDPGDGSSREEKFLSVFNPNQVKSATGNQGTFDPSNPDITKADGGALTDDEGITAYHGSPHDFEKFDTSKIGTGEGAQAYGHGLYFAQNENTAKEYRDSLSANNPEPIEVDGERFHQPTRMQRLVANHFGDVDAVLKEMEPNWEYAIDKHLSLPDDADELERMVAEDNAIEAHRERFAVEGMRGKTVKYGKPGHMYEVHINAHPDHFLDWDAPLSQQSEHVQKRLSPHHSVLSQAAMDMFDGKPEDLSGSDLYQWLSGEHEGGLGSPKHVTEQLSNLGIKGIKYLDAGSRGAGEGTRNYVVFDHNNVAVKRKYEQGGVVG